MMLVPDSWVQTSFTNVFDIQGGTQPPKSTFIYEAKDGYIQLLQIRDFGERPVPTFIPDTRNLKKCEDEDILIARYGASLGRILTGLSGTYNVAMAKVVIPPELNRRYVFHLLNSEQFQSPLKLVSRSAQNGFNKDDLAEFRINIAPQNEQKLIADKLDAVLARVDACRDRLDRIPAILKRFRQSVLAAATSGVLTEDWRTDIAEPNNWQDVCLREVILDMRNGHSPKPTVAPPGDRILRISAVRPGLLDLNDHRYLVVAEKDAALYALKQDDLLFTRYNGSLDFVGVCATVKQDAEGYVYPDKLIRVRINTNMVLSRFIELTFGCSSVRYQIENFVKSSAGQKGISGADLKKTRFLLPSLTEQAEIVRRVESLFAYADRLEARYHAARAQVEKLTPSLLAKAFRGELVPQDPNDEPASELLARIAAARSADKLVKARHSPRGKTARSSEMDVSDLLTASV